jgi:hypothetical protein
MHAQIEKFLTPVSLPAVLAVLAVLIVFAFLRTRGFRYTKVEKLLTPMEMRFYRLLTKAVGRELLIFVKVRIGDLMDAHPGMDRIKRRTAFNKIACKHIDFVICDKELKILLGIELDDKSHEREDRKVRDKFVNAAFKSAGINLLRISGKHYYNIDVIKQQIFNALP